jgi:hypothetical protein
MVLVLLCSNIPVTASKSGEGNFFPGRFVFLTIIASTHYATIVSTYYVWETCTFTPEGSESTVVSENSYRIGHPGGVSFDDSLR